MQLYLMQHGQALSEEEDPERPLSREGVAQIQASAAAVKKLGLRFDAMVCSSKKRARQTAALVAETVNYPYSDLVETDRVKAKTPPEETVAFLRQLERRSVFVAGHLPSLNELAAQLLTGGSKVAIHIENGGLLCLDCAKLPTTEAVLEFYLNSAQMRLIGTR